MNLSFHENAALPKLAWLALVRPAESITDVIHGPFVERGDRFFVEGVWDGDFGAGGFELTECFFGSGGTADENGITFVSSASTTDYLYWTAAPAGVYVANSLPLLLAQRKDHLDPCFTGYQEINYSIIKGIDGYARDLPTARGGVKRLMYRNLRISATGAKEVDKPMPPAFPSYDEYAEYLVTRYGGIAANARDARRSRPMGIVSTQSRGYDTTAINAVAAPFGVDRAFTVTRGKSGGAFADHERGEGANDDGTEICGVLGIPCVPIDRRSFEREFGDESLYYAALDDNQDFNLRDIAGHVSGATVLLTGTLGELWYTRQSYEAHIQRYGLIDDRLKRVDLGGHGLTEVRLAAGIVHLPFPYIGARRRADIQAITESPAMDAWRLRNAYDRPIPRRLAEDAGIPRHMFGQSKIATVVQFAPPPVPYGRKLREEYFEFLTRHRLLRPWQLSRFPLVHRVNSILWYAREHRYALVYYAQRVISKVIRREYQFPMWWRRLNGRLFCFAVNRRAAEYGAMLDAAGALTKS